VIPRFQPAIGVDELRALANAPAGSVARLERAFADHFGGGEGIAFSYGRTALWALLQALDLKDAEVILPAYTCSVVAHAVTLSRNVCRFVDATLSDYNMNLDEVERAITPATRMIVATHLFGFPLDVDRLRVIVSAAERVHGHKIWIVQDCAHAFGARWRGRLVAAEADIALFGMNISKSMTSIFGGMLTTADGALASRVRAWRDAHERKAPAGKALARRAYLVAATAAFRNSVYGAVRWLQDETPVLQRLTDAYHKDDEIAFPPDYQDAMLDVEAAVGLVQLARLDGFEQKRREHAAFYLTHLGAPAGWTLPPLVEGATYSHFPVRVADRAREIARFRRAGVQVGEVIEYSVPHLSCYGAHGHPQMFPNAWLCSSHMINLPVHPTLTDAGRQRVVDAVSAVAA
jgi:dTDP-4-amino-4,6-dideoxygalactose transaminase